MEIGSERLQNGGDDGTVPAVLGQSLEAVDVDGAVVEGEGHIGDDLVWRDGAQNAEPRTMGARAEGIVEREHPRFQRADRDPVLRTGEVGGELRHLAVPVARYGLHPDEAVGFPQRAFHGIGDAGACVRLNDDAVDD